MVYHNCKFFSDLPQNWNIISRRNSLIMSFAKLVIQANIMQVTKIPKQIEIVNDYASLILALKKTVKNNSLTCVLICSGKYSSDALANKVSEDLSDCVNVENKIVYESDIAEILQLDKIKSFSELYEILERSGINTKLVAKTSTAIIAIGGGKLLDYCKYLAYKSQTQLISVPSLVSNNGICSSLAVLHTNNYQAQMPIALLVPLYIIQDTPLEHLQAAIGDLIGKLALPAKQEFMDDFAAILSNRSSLGVIQLLQNYVLTSKSIEPELILRDKDFLRALIENLGLSGIATSYSANLESHFGFEYLISLAIDELFGSKTLHGIQVLIASLYLEKLNGVDLLTGAALDYEHSSLKTLLLSLAFPCEFEDIDLSKSDIEQVLKLATSKVDARCLLTP